MRTITYKAEAAHRDKSDHVLGTRLVPSSDDSNNNSRTVQEQDHTVDWGV
jgi:hypothetical protein